MNKLKLALSVAVLSLGVGSACLAIHTKGVTDELKATQNAYWTSFQKNEATTKVLLESQKNVQNLKELLSTEKEKSSIIQNDLGNVQAEVKKLKEQNEALQKEIEKKTKALQPTKISTENPVRVLKSKSVKASKTLRMVGTAYTANDAGMNGKGKTATGTTVKQGRTISVDPRVIPLGSRVYITSKSYPAINGVYVAEDTGSAIKGNKIDIYFKSKKTALLFGKRKDLVVKILSES